MPTDYYFDDQNAQVSKTLVRCGNSSFPINGISSVQVLEPDRSKYNRASVISLIIAAFAFASSGLTIVAVVAVVAMIYSFVSALGLPHALILATASGDKQALTSREIDYLHKIKLAIEKAVAERG